MPFTSRKKSRDEAIYELTVFFSFLRPWSFDSRISAFFLSYLCPVGRSEIKKKKKEKKSLTVIFVFRVEKNGFLNFFLLEVLSL